MADFLLHPYMISREGENQRVRGREREGGRDEGREGKEGRQREAGERGRDFLTKPPIL